MQISSAFDEDNEIRLISRQQWVYIGSYRAHYFAAAMCHQRLLALLGSNVQNFARKCYEEIRHRKALRERRDFQKKISR